MRLKPKSKNPCILSIVILLLLIVIGSCKKEISKNFDISPPNTLSKDAPDLAIRLAAIREKFYADKLDKKLIPNIDQKLSWTPDWDHPKVQTVNDSVSYVFYRLIGKVKINDKIQEVTEKGAASFLMVKDEGEFFKALYYYPQMPNEKSKVKTKINMQNFSGKLLLNNLHNGENFLLDYAKGKLSESYQKKQLLTLNKLAINNPSKKSYWSQQCRTEYRACTFVSDGYSYCGGGIDVIYSEYCNWPSSACGVTYSLTDSDERLICEDIWFPDPPEPVDPEENGENSTNPDALKVTDIENMTVNEITEKPIQDIDKYLDCFNDGKIAAFYKLTIYVDQPVAGTNLQSNIITVAGPTSNLVLVQAGEKFDVGHTFVGFQKVNVDGTQVEQILGFYPSADPTTPGIYTKGYIMDNSGHDYDISYSKEVNNIEFTSALAKLKGDFIESNYSVLNYNCTDAALKWMNAADSNLSSVPRGIFNNTPGDFGQELRNNYETSNKSSGKAANSKGPCN